MRQLAAEGAIEVRLVAGVRGIREDRVEAVEHLVVVVHVVAVGVREARVRRGVEVADGEGQRTGFGRHVRERVHRDGRERDALGVARGRVVVLPVVGVGGPVPGLEGRVDVDPRLDARLVVEGQLAGVGEAGGLEPAHAGGVVVGERRGRGAVGGVRGAVRGVVDGRQEEEVRVVVAVGADGAAIDGVVVPGPLVVLEVLHGVDEVLLVVVEAVAVVVERALLLGVLVVAGAGVEVGAVHAAAGEVDGAAAGEVGVLAGLVGEAALPVGVALRAGVLVFPGVGDVVEVGVDAAGVETGAGDVAAEHGGRAELRDAGVVVVRLVHEGGVAFVGVGEVVAVGVGVPRVGGPPLVVPVAIRAGEGAVGADAGVVQAELGGVALVLVGEALEVVVARRVRRDADVLDGPDGEVGVGRGRVDDAVVVGADGGADIEFPAVGHAVAVGVAAVGGDLIVLDEVVLAAEGDGVGFKGPVRVAESDGLGVLDRVRDVVGAVLEDEVAALAVGHRLRHVRGGHRLALGDDAMVDEPAREGVLGGVIECECVRGGELHLAVALEIAGGPARARVESVNIVHVVVQVFAAVPGHVVAVGVAIGVVAEGVEAPHDLPAVVHGVAVGVPADGVRAEEELLEVGEAVAVGVEGDVVVGDAGVEVGGDDGVVDRVAIDDLGGVVRLAYGILGERGHAPEVVFVAVREAVAVGIGLRRVGAVEVAVVGVGEDAVVVVGALVGLVHQVLDLVGVLRVEGGVRAADFVEVDEGKAVGGVVVAALAIDIGEVAVIEDALDAGREEVVVVVAGFAEVAGRGLKGVGPLPRRVLVAAGHGGEVEVLPGVGEAVPVDVGVVVLGVVLAGEDAADLAVLGVAAVAELDRGGGGSRHRDEAPLAAEGVLVAEPDVEEAVILVVALVAVVVNADEGDGFGPGNERGRGGGRGVLDLPVDLGGHHAARRLIHVVVDRAAAEALQALVAVLADIDGKLHLVLVDEDLHGGLDFDGTCGCGDAAVLVVEFDGDAEGAGHVVGVAGGPLRAVVLGGVAVAPVDDCVEAQLVRVDVRAGPADGVGEALAALGRFPAFGGRAYERRVHIGDEERERPLGVGGALRRGGDGDVGVAVEGLHRHGLGVGGPGAPDERRGAEEAKLVCESGIDGEAYGRLLHGRAGKRNRQLRSAGAFLEL